MLLEQIEVENFVFMPYMRVLTYPVISADLAKERLEQIKRLGIRRIEFTGKVKIGEISLLGLGTQSLVVCAFRDHERLALKIRRVDSNRESMEREYKITSLVNRIGIGPRVVSYSNDFLIMDLIEGISLDEWVASLKRRMKTRLRSLVHNLLNQCRKLDIIGVDHGELSNLKKHVIISNDKPYIIDFESASLQRKVRNVTSAAQYLFIGSSVSSRIRKILNIKKTESVLRWLKSYKQKLDDYSYSKILESIGVTL